MRVSKMNINELQKISWRRAMSMKSKTVIGSSIALKRRAEPYTIDPLGVIAYNACSTCRTRQWPVYGKHAGGVLEFARLKHHTGAMFADRNQLIIHAGLKDFLSNISKVEFHPAKCIGIYDVDPLDTRSLGSLVDDQGGDFELETLLDLCGLRTLEDHWLEVVVPSLNSGVHKIGPPFIDVDFEKSSLDSVLVDQGVHFHNMTPRPVSLAAVLDVGLVHGQCFVASLPVALFLQQHLSPLFWQHTLWTLDGGDGARTR